MWELCGTRLRLGRNRPVAGSTFLARKSGRAVIERSSSARMILGLVSSRNWNVLDRSSSEYARSAAR